MSPVAATPSVSQDTPATDPSATTTSVQHAIMAEMLSGDSGVAGAVGMLRDDAVLISKLLATFPANLGANLDTGA